MNEGRTKNSIKNLFCSYFGHIINIFLKFVVRFFFVKILTTEYLGLNGLFGNILAFLSFAELGIGGAITYNLYIELAKDNKIRIKQLMKLYKTAYMLIGCFVLFVGSSLTPFLNFFIANNVNIPNLQLIYLLFVINSGCSYFFSYKASFITANQKNYIIANTSLVSNIIIAVIQLVILFLTKNYVAYLLVQIVVVFLSNVVISFIADKRYPILKERVEGKLDEDSQQTIVQNVSAAVFHKIGGIVVFSTDNILMSKIFGLIQVGLYSNYTLLTKTLQGIISQFFISISASVGNLCAVETQERKIRIFYIIEYINFIIYSLCGICIFELLEEFICLWLGNSFLMDKSIIYFLTINFYLEGMRSTVQTFNGAMGLARFYKYMPIPECMINLAISIILGKLIGPVGILIGTTISTLATCFWIEPMILYKYGFSASVKKYYVVYLKYLVITLFVLGIVHTLNDFINTTLPVLNFLIHGLICVCIFCSVVWFMSRKTIEFEYLFDILKKIIGK